MKPQSRVKILVCGLLLLAAIAGFLIFPVSTKTRLHHNAPPISAIIPAPSDYSETVASSVEAMDKLVDGGNKISSYDILIRLRPFLEKGDYSAEDQKQFLESLKKSGMNNAEWENCVKLFSDFSHDPAFLFELADLLYSGQTKTSILEHTCNYATEDNLPVFANALGKVQNDKLKATLVGQVTDRVLNKDNLQTLTEWIHLIKDERDKDALERALLHSVEVYLRQPGNSLAMIPFVELSTRFTRTQISNLAETYAVYYASQSDMKSLKEVFNTYPAEELYIPLSQITYKDSPGLSAATASEIIQLLPLDMANRMTSIKNLAEKVRACEGDQAADDFIRDFVEKVQPTPISN